MSRLKPGTFAFARLLALTVRSMRMFFMAFTATWIIRSILLFLYSKLSGLDKRPGLRPDLNDGLCQLRGGFNRL